MKRKSAIATLYLPSLEGSRSGFGLGIRILTGTEGNLPQPPCDRAAPSPRRGLV
ncbi:MAG TPA: hypothetical protein V6D03_03280 [Candidatus Caenarcaniphilales bacterium]